MSLLARNPRVPWPYPEANVLVDEHFDEPSAPSWRRTGAVSETGAVLNRSNSSPERSRTRVCSQNKEGMHYLQIGCGGRQCDPGQALFQDVPIDRVKDGERIDYGFSGVVEGSEGGPMRVELSNGIRQGTNCGARPLTPMCRHKRMGFEP